MPSWISFSMGSCVEQKKVGEDLIFVIASFCSPHLRFGRGLCFHVV